MPKATVRALLIGPTIAHGRQGALGHDKRGCVQRLGCRIVSALDWYEKKDQALNLGKFSKDYLNVRAFVGLEPGNLGLSPGSATNLLCAFEQTIASLISICSPLQCRIC